MNLIRLLGKHPRVTTRRLHDGALLTIERGRQRERLRIGPNEVHAFITHPDGDITDIGISHNLLTNAGRDLVAAALGARAPAENAASAVSSTSLTDSGESWTTDAFKGWRVIAEQSTNRPVFGNIGANSTTVLTIDDWWDPDFTAAAADPSSTADYILMPTCQPIFLAATENSASASASNTTLTGEITTGGLGRGITTYAHSAGTATLTLQRAFSVTASFPAVHRIGLFTASTLTAGGVMVFESVLNADASVVNGDTLTVTDTISLS